jgi:hypothetical protein
MKASELIENIKKAIEIYGDLDIEMPLNEGGIISWPPGDITKINYQHTMIKPGKWEDIPCTKLVLWPEY